MSGVFFVAVAALVENAWYARGSQNGLPPAQHSPLRHSQRAAA